MIPSTSLRLKVLMTPLSRIGQLTFREYPDLLTGPENWKQIEKYSDNLQRYLEFIRSKHLTNAGIAETRRVIGLFDDLTVCTPLPRYLPFPKFLLDAQLSPSRYRSQKPLIVTTNLTLNEIRHPQDTAHARIYNRILEMCVPISYIVAVCAKRTHRKSWNPLKSLIG